MKFLSNINLSKNQLQNAVIQPLADNPSSPVVGQIYFDSTTAVLKIYRKIGSDAAFWDTVGVTNLSVGTVTATNVPILSSAGTGIGTLPAATGTAAGILTAEAQTIGGAKTFADGVITGSGTQTWQIESGTSALSFRSGSSSPVTRMSIGTDGVLTATGFTGSGANLTNLDAGAIASGTLAVARGGTGTGEYTKGDILYSNATNGLAKLGIGTQGKVLRVSSTGIPEWATGGSVDNPLVLKFDTGTTEGTDLYTYDGSGAKTIDFKGGTAITLDDAVAGAITIKHSDVSRTNTTTDPVPAATAFGGTFTVIDSVTSNSQGHITGANTKNVTLPTETQLSVTPSSGVFFDANPSVSNHAITFSRSNTTTAAVTVGQLTITKAEDPAQTGNLAVGGNVTIAGNLTVSGTTTTINTETIRLADNIIELNSNLEAQGTSGTVVGQSSSTNTDGGLEIKRFEWNGATWTDASFQIQFNETNKDFRVGRASSLQPVLTRAEHSALADGDILVYDHTNKRAVGKTFDEIALPQKFAVTLHGTQASQSAYPTTSSNVVSISENEKDYTITHSLGTSDVTVTLREVGGEKEIIHTNIVITDANIITIKFATVPTQGVYRVTIIG